MINDVLINFIYKFRSTCPQNSLEKISFNSYMNLFVLLNASQFEIKLSTHIMLVIYV